MKKITKMQKEQLEKAGLLKYRVVKNGVEVQNQNFTVANREHCSRDKTYYVTEEYKIMSFLGYIDKKDKFKQHKKNNNFNKRRKETNDK